MNEQELSKEIKILLAIRKLQGRTTLCLAIDLPAVKCPTGLCERCSYYMGKREHVW